MKRLRSEDRQGKDPVIETWIQAQSGSSWVVPFACRSRSKFVLGTFLCDWWEKNCQSRLIFGEANCFLMRKYYWSHYREIIFSITLRCNVNAFSCLHFQPLAKLLWWTTTIVFNIVLTFYNSSWLEYQIGSCFRSRVSEKNRCNFGHPSNWCLFLICSLRESEWRILRTPWRVQGPWPRSNRFILYAYPHR